METGGGRKLAWVGCDDNSLHRESREISPIGLTSSILEACFEIRKAVILLPRQEAEEMTNKGPAPPWEVDRQLSSKSRLLRCSCDKVYHNQHNHNQQHPEQSHKRLLARNVL